MRLIARTSRGVDRHAAGRRRRPRLGRLVAPILALLVALPPLPPALPGAPSPVRAAGPDPSTLSAERPLVPPTAAELVTGEPTYVDDGSGTSATDGDLPTDPPTAAAVDGTGLVTPAIAALAAELGNDPLAIYAYVRNTFEYEPYYVGAVKGTQETLDARAGNDVDLASLLVALLRSGGTPARYAQRVIKVPADVAASWVGVEDPITAARVLAASGKAVTVVLRSGRPVALMFEQVWVEAYVSEGGGKAWKALDASYKLHTIRPGRNLPAEAGLTGQALRDALAATADADPSTRTVRTVDLERFDGVLADRRTQLVSWLEAEAPGVTLTEAIGGRTIVTESITTLPTRPPYRGRGSTTRFDQIPAAAKQQIRFQTYGLDATLNVADIAARRVTLGFVPATATDAAAIAAAGGITQVRPASVNLKAQLRLDGAVVAEGAAAPVGYYAYFLLDYSRGGTFLGQSVHVVSIGGTYAVALDTQTVPVGKIARSRDRLAAARAANRPALGDDVLGELLHGLGLSYFRFNDLTTEYLAGTQNALAFQQVSQALVGQDLVADVSGPVPRMALGGITIDAKRSYLSLYDRAGRADFRTFPLFTAIGTSSSGLESVFLDVLLGWPAVSTIEALRTAADEELAVQGIGPENAAAIVPTLGVPQAVKDRIAEVTASGRRVIIPTASQRLADWRGDAWIEYDPATGAAGFLIAGGTNGGAFTVRLVESGQDGWDALVNGLADGFVAFLDGLIAGDFNRTGYDSPILEGLRLGGQFVSGLLIAGDVRDLAAALQSGSAGDVGLAMVAFVPVLGDLAKGARATAKASLTVLRRTVDPAAARAICQEVAGDLADDLVVVLGRSGEIRLVQRTLLRDLSTTTTPLVKNGIAVEHKVVGDGAELLRRLRLDPADGSILNRARIGESVADALAADRKWVRIDIKVDPTRPGIDRVYLDPSTGRYKIIETKFFEGGDVNFPTSRLKTEVDDVAETELSNTWLVKDVEDPNDAINRSVKAGSITLEQGEELRAAIRAGLVDKELVVVKNNIDGRTVANSLGANSELGALSTNPVTVTVVELGRVLPPAP